MAFTRPSSILLADWGAYLGTYRSPKKLVNDLILLSLLYDNVLIQDEILVLIPQLANWFGTSRGLDLLHKIFCLDSIKLLKWPTYAYTSNICTDPIKHPMFARAEWHVKNSTAGDQLFRPTEQQAVLYKELEAILSVRRRAARDRWTKSKIDVYQSFRDILRNVLSKEAFTPWLRFQYSAIKDKTKEEYIGYITDPARAVHDLRKNKPEIRVVYKNGIPDFSRSLGFQVSTLYDRNEKLALQSLIQSVYAIPLCESEHAIGRYSGRLMEIPWFEDEEKVPAYLDAERVLLEPATNKILYLPDVMDDFPKVVNEIRSTEAGKALRKAFADLGKTLSLKEIESCWSSVAHELSSHVKQRGKKYVARTVMGILSVAEISVATIVDFAEIVHPTGLPPLLESAIPAFIGRGFGLCSDLGYKLLNKRLLRFKTYRELNRAVNIRCTWLPTSSQMSSM